MHQQLHKILEPFSHYNNPIRLVTFTTSRSMLFGAGMSYAIDKESYMHIPIIWFIPSVYAGYTLFSNKNTIVDCYAKEKQSFIMCQANKSSELQQE